MIRNLFSFCFLTMMFITCAACAPQRAAPDGAPNMANPAAVYCAEQGGKQVIREDANGQAGVCTFADGSYCDEWAFFRGECKAGQATPTTPAAVATLEPAAPSRANANQASAAVQADDWQVYTNEKLGYAFDYPPGAFIANADEPLNGLMIAGPEVDGNAWPDIYIAHPSDRNAFRPTEGANLYQWLSLHNLLGDEHDRRPDVTIAGTTAIHLRHARSPQSFAYDRYYFVQDGQLYQITIGHAGDQEDWQVYGRFLDSFKFTGQ